jgi:hypothetical protein
MDNQEQEEALFNTCHTLLTGDVAMNDVFIPVIITMEYTIQFGARAPVFSTEAF